MTQIKQAKIEQRKVADLTNWEDNPRSIVKEDFERLKKQIVKLGMYKPLLINENNIVLGGNMRLRALTELGAKEVAVTVVDALTPEAMLEYALSDNDQVGVTDDLKLAELVHLNPIDTQLYKVQSNVLRPLESIVNPPDPIVQDEIPDIDSEPPVSKLGEIYQLGRHRLMCGDSTNFDTVSELMSGIKADMCFTDPPYGVNYEGGHFHSGNVNIRRKREKLQQDDSTQIYKDVVPIIAQFTNGPCYTFYADTKPTDLYIAVEAIGEIHALLIWHKTNATYAAMNAQYKQRHEPFLYWKPKGSPLRWCGATTEATIWELTKDGKNDMHPTQKPIHLAAKAIQNHKADSVLDLFGGSGSTLIACEQLGRTCYMMELEPKYVDVIRKRYYKFTTGNDDGWEEGTKAI